MNNNEYNINIVFLITSRIEGCFNCECISTSLRTRDVIPAACINFLSIYIIPCHVTQLHVHVMYIHTTHHFNGNNLFCLFTLCSIDTRKTSLTNKIKNIIVLRQDKAEEEEQEEGRER